MLPRSRHPRLPRNEGPSPEIAPRAPCPTKIDELDHCAMTARARFGCIKGGAPTKLVSAPTSPDVEGRARVRSSPRSPPAQSRSATTPNRRNNAKTRPAPRGNGPGKLPCRRDPSTTLCSPPRKRPSPSSFHDFVRWGLKISRNSLRARPGTAACQVLPTAALSASRGESSSPTFQALGRSGPHLCCR